jgi:hypothetical protein
MRLYEVHTFPERIYCYHHRVVSVGLGEFRDEVDGHNLPRVLRNRQWLKLSYGCASILLGAQTQIAGTTVGSYVAQHLGPPV